MAETQTAYARSAWTDQTNMVLFAGALIEGLSDPHVGALIPAWLLPKIGAAIFLLGIYVRTWKATHPVANIPPGEVKPVEVKKLEATKQGTEDAINLPPQLPSGEVPK